MKKMIYEIDLSLDKQQLGSETQQMSQQITRLKADLVNLSTFFSNCISTAISNVEKLTSTVKTMTKVSETAISILDLSPFKETLDDIHTATKNILQEIKSSNFLDILSTSVDTLTFIQTAYGHYQNYNPKGAGSQSKVNTSKGTTPSISAPVSQSSLPPNSAGSIDSLFPDIKNQLALEKWKILLTELSELGTTVKGDEIGRISGDVSTAIGSLTEKLASATAAIDSQKAAMDAWNGVSSIASSTTTAFGSAMDIASLKAQLITLVIAAIIAIIAYLIANWDAVCAKAKEVWTAIQEKLSAFDEFLKNIFAKDFTEQFGAFGAVLNVFFDSVEGVWNAIKKVFGGIVDFVKNVFAGNWSAAWDSIVQIFTGIWEGIVGYFKPPLNAIIGFINGLISAIVNAVNFVIRAVNKLSIDIPNWDIFGSLAGKTFGLNIPLVSGCEIPYLAKGAVLPANRPFMAIVGDQRHGTNVEAPLATIQEAVAVVMEDQTAAIVAGFNASIGIQRELLSAVLGIRIGDEVIGRAADRYFAKRAAMGGY